MSGLCCFWQGGAGGERGPVWKAEQALDLGALIRKADNIDPLPIMKAK